MTSHINDTDALHALCGWSLKVLFQVVAGIVVPVLDNVLSSRTKLFLIHVLPFFETTGILFIFSSCGFLVDSLFKFFGVWHATRFFPPLLRHLGGGETDDQFYRSLANLQLELYLYFAPIIAFRVMRVLWPICGIVIVVFLTGFWALCPRPLRSDIGTKIILRFLDGYHYMRRYDISIRGLFMQVYEAVIGPFKRWEVSVARQRCERRLASLKPYKYRNLETLRHIRLLRLKGRFFFSEPIFELIHVSLDEAPAFEAVSYVWGVKDPSIPVSVDGQQVLVTPAIYDLLFYQKKLFCSKLFWIDALCINQNDKDEKNEQLPLMTEIYRRASRVIIWLGPPEDVQETLGVRKLIRVLSTLNVLHEFIIALANHLPSIRRFSNTSNSNFIPVLFRNQKAAIVALGQLFDHPWFERIWVLQELAVGETVHVMYKGVCIEWDTLALVARQIASDTDLSCQLYYLSKTSSIKMSDTELKSNSSINMIDIFKSVNTEMMAITRNDFQSFKPLFLSSLMLLTLSFKSKDPRDKVFALLGIASDGNQLPFKPNYKDSAELVFIKTTTFLLSLADWFFVLNFAGRGYESTISAAQSPLRESLPSWVPDYISYTVSGVRFDAFGNALSCDRTGKVTFTNNPRIIQLQAVAFDVIQHVSLGLKFGESPASLLNQDDFLEIGDTYQFVLEKRRLPQPLAGAINEIREWCLHVRQFARKYSPKPQETVDQELWDLCIRGTDEGIKDKFSTISASISSRARKFLEFFLFADQEMFEEEMFGEEIFESAMGEKFTTEMGDMQQPLIQRWLDTVKGKAFSITAAGSIALVPPLTREGDVLVHVRGGFAPIVLRQKHLGKRVAELVGTCSVHGVEDTYFGSNWKDWLLE